jgi:hypothetical protein
MSICGVGKGSGVKAVPDLCQWRGEEKLFLKTEKSMNGPIGYWIF